jgi:hypothetical protein
VSYKTQRPANEVTRETQGTRQLSQRILLTGQPGTDAQKIVEVYTPSRRLSVGIEVFFEPNVEAESVIALYNATWTTRAKAVGVKLSDVNLHVIESAVALPRMYELDSSIRIFRVQADFVSPPTTAAAVFVFGNWYLRALWEPNTPLRDEELQHLFADCHLG